MADQKHEHGSMDIEVQEKTFETFLTWITQGIVVILVSLVLLYLING